MVDNGERLPARDEYGIVKTYLLFTVVVSRPAAVSLYLPVNSKDKPPR